jgi:hypothetical protein
MSDRAKQLIEKQINKVNESPSDGDNKAYLEGMHNLLTHHGWTHQHASSGGHNFYRHHEHSDHLMMVHRGGGGVHNYWTHHSPDGIISGHREHSKLKSHLEDFHKR